jgi:hypothetical protein
VKKASEDSKPVYANGNGIRPYSRRIKPVKLGAHDSAYQVAEIVRHLLDYGLDDPIGSVTVSNGCLAITSGKKTTTFLPTVSTHEDHVCVSFKGHDPVDDDKTASLHFAMKSLVLQAIALLQKLGRYKAFIRLGRSATSCYVRPRELFPYLTSEQYKKLHGLLLGNSAVRAVEDCGNQTFFMQCTHRNKRKMINIALVACALA